MQRLLWVQPVAFVGNDISYFLDDDSVVFCTQNVWFRIQIVH